MKKFIVIAALFLLYAARPARAQIVPDCGNCTNATWGEQWHPTLQTCVGSLSLGCGSGCNCAMGLMAVISVKAGKASASTDFFGGAFVRDAKGVITGFRIDRPGPLARNHIKAGDVVWRVNGRRPALSQFGTQKRPIRRAGATWSDDGLLRLRLRY